MKEKKLAVVGLGRMGGNMARCLSDKGYSVSAVYDIRPEVTREIAAKTGAEAAEGLGLADALGLDLDKSAVAELTFPGRS
ncbi:MAG: NAD(P)-binding domain-containing protein [Puniceicoccaceae bacterium]